MKKKLILFLASFLMTLSVTFAQNIKPVPTSIVNELHQEFKNASNVQWKTTDNYYKASFTVDGNPLDAFYSFEDQLIAVSRNITLEQLPMSLIKELKNKAATNQVTELFELLTDRGTEYFITFKNNKESKTYKSSGYSWTRY